MAIDRKTLQATLAPAIESALSSVVDLNMQDEEHQRRFMRALVHIGARELLLRGVSLKQVAAHIALALSHENEEFQKAISSASALHAMILPEKIAQA